MDCFLYDNGFRHERVNQQISVLNDTTRGKYTQNLIYNICKSSDFFLKLKIII